MSNFEAKPTEILSDSPPTDESQDCLRRVPFVNALYQEITKLPFEDSFCFGLYGSWGEGKTSVLNFLKNKLQKNKEIILFEFDPWYLASKEAILKNFLEGLEKKLRPVSKKFKKVFNKYFRKLSIGAYVFGTGGQIGWEFEKAGLLELKDGINCLIKKSKKKILILIDDIDRLQPDEILLVFKLVKLIADFKHTAFVLSFDPEAVKSSLQRQNIDIDYVDKIVQKPISLPKIEQSDIDQFFERECNNLLERLSIVKRREEDELKNFSFVYPRHARKLFTTLRSVKRYVNSLSSSLPPVVNEVHLFDFLFLEFVKVFAPRAYDDIYKNWWFYVPQRTCSEALVNPFEWGLEKEKRKEIVKEHINQLFKDEQQKEVFIDLLMVLFPYVNEAFESYHRFSPDKTARQEKRVYSTSFLKYFTLSVPSQELPDKLVEELISSWTKLLPEKLAEAITNALLQLKQQEKLTEFLIKLHTFRADITPEITRPLIRCICNISSDLSQRDLGGDWLNSEFNRATHLIIDLLRDKIDKIQIHDVLREIMQNTSLCFAYDIYILWPPPGEGGNYDIKRVRKTLVDSFKNSFVVLGRDIFQTKGLYYRLFGLGQDGKNGLWDLCAEEENVGHKECTCAKYVEGLLKENPQYLGRVLDCFVSRYKEVWSSGSKKPSRSSRFTTFDISEAARYFNTDAIYKTIKGVNNVFYSTDEEKEALELFCKKYEELIAINKNKGPSE